MINPHNVIKILANYVAEFLPPTTYLYNDARDESVATQLYENLLLIIQSSEYQFENEHTLDFIHDQQSQHYSDESDVEDMMGNDADYDENDDAKENSPHNFSLEYMKKAIAYYDEADPNTGKKKHS